MKTAKRSKPLKTADGKTIRVGQEHYEIRTRDGGQTWAVHGPFQVVTMSCSTRGWRYFGARYFNTDMGDNRSYANRENALREAIRRDKYAPAPRRKAGGK